MSKRYQVPAYKHKKGVHRSVWMAQHCPDEEGLSDRDRELVNRFHRRTRKNASVVRACLCSAYIEDKSTGRQRKCRRRAMVGSIFCKQHKNKSRRPASKNKPIYDRSAKKHDKRMDLPGFVGSNFYGCGCNY